MKTTGDANGPEPTTGHRAAPSGTTMGATDGGATNGGKTIGLTGGIASGKSTAASYLGECGAFVIDADRLGHQAYEPGTGAFDRVVATFGNEVVGADGRIDRKMLGGKVFGNPAALEQLTGIVWPEILRLAQLEIDSARKSDPARVVVLEAAVLLEAGWDSAVDEVWVVVVPPAVAVERAMARDGANAEAVQKRLDSQLSNEARMAKADVVILNDGDPQALRSKVETQWRALAAS